MLLMNYVLQTPPPSQKGIIIFTRNVSLKSWENRQEKIIENLTSYRQKYNGPCASETGVLKYANNQR